MSDTISEEQEKYIVDVLRPVLKALVTTLLKKCPSGKSKFMFEYNPDLEGEESPLVRTEDDLMFHNTLIVLLNNHRSNVNKKNDDDSSFDTSDDGNTGKMRKHINPKKRRRPASRSTQELSNEDSEESRSPNRRSQSVSSISEIEGIVNREVRPYAYTLKKRDGTNAVRLETPGQGTLTWSGSQTYAHHRGGRLLTLEEAQSYLSERASHVDLKGTSQWAAVTVEKGEADWVQIGCADTLSPGDSYMEKMEEYPAWGDDTREPLACNNVVLWMPPPRGHAMVIVEYFLLAGRKEFPLTTTFGEIVGYFKDYFDAVGEFRIEDKDNHAVLESEIKYAKKKEGNPIFEMKSISENAQKQPERISIPKHLARRSTRRVQFIEKFD